MNSNAHNTFLRSPNLNTVGGENMYYGANKAIFERAKELRLKMTKAEEILWKEIHINEWKLKFRRQHPIFRYVVDFYCHPIKLVIELDGGIHNLDEVKRYDEEREQNLKEFGLTVLRFKNEDVIDNRQSVIAKISNVIRHLQSSLLGDGGGGADRGIANKEQLHIIKIGGNIVDDEQSLASFLVAFTQINGKKILVHGGGKIATRIGEALGIQSKFVDGRRITDADTIDLVTMVYGGLINKKIVAKLQSLGCNALGITGADANLIPASKRLPVKESGIDYGFVGDVNSNRLPAARWQWLLEEKLVPVVAPLTHDEQGHMLNTNADTMAQEIARALCKDFDVTLVYSFEKAGVLLDAQDDKTVINKIDPETFAILKAEQKIFAGMIPKLENAFEALQHGVRKVIIGNAENLQQLLQGEAGTTIVNG